mgnify:CR=1 FL=1
MRAGIVEGVLATASDNIAAPFLSLYALSLGATKTQIGLVTALPALLGSVLQFPAALLTDRFRRRRLLMLIGTIGLRPTWLLVPLLALWFPGAQAVVAYLVFLAVRSAIGSAAPAAWTSVMADVVPKRIRGAYFANRNILCNLSALIASVAAGWLVRLFGTPSGYHAVFVLAGLVGAVAAYTMTWFPDVDRLRSPSTPLAESPGAPAESRVNPFGLWQRAVGFARRERAFLWFTGFSVLWNFGVTLPQPLFAVYYVEDLGGSEGMWGVVNAASLLMTVVGQRYWGPLADRYGNRNLMIASGVFAAFASAVWLLAARPWHAILVNVYGGFVWAGYNLAAFNLVLEMTPDARRATYVAAYNALIGLAQFAGPIAGGIMADAVGIEAVLLAATGLRMAGWVLLRTVMRAPEEQEFRWRNYLWLPVAAQYRLLRSRLHRSRLWRRPAPGAGPGKGLGA